jgi:hypothetical protein
MATTNKQQVFQGTRRQLPDWHGFRNVIGERCAMGMARPDDGDAG